MIKIEGARLAKAEGTQWVCMREFHFFTVISYDRGKPRCPLCSADHFMHIDEVIRRLEAKLPLTSSAA